MIVADTNLIAYLLIPGDFTNQSQAVFKKDPDWVAPVLWRSEFCNVLALYMRKGYLKLAQTIAMAHEAENLLGGREYAVVSSEVLVIAAESGCAAYDCEFVALARNLKVQLVTSDEQILKRFPADAVHIKDFT